VPPGVYEPFREQRVDPGRQVPDIRNKRQALQRLGVDVVDQVFRVLEVAPGGYEAGDKLWLFAHVGSREPFAVIVASRRRILLSHVVHIDGRREVLVHKKFAGDG
jgi:hypothetical protein